MIRVDPVPGFYGGAALPDGVRFRCGKGRAELVDWRDVGLSAYSGMVRYTQVFRMPDPSVVNPVVLGLGKVRVSVKVVINGSTVGFLYREPFRLEISSHVMEGENRLVLYVAYTLANHYSIGMPDANRYVDVDSLESGLFGPVVITPGDAGVFPVCQ